MSFHDRIFLLMKEVKIVYVNDITAHCQKLEESSVIAGIKHKSILLIPVCCLNHVITIILHFLKDILLQYSNTCEGLLGGAHNTRRMDYIIYTQEGRTYNPLILFPFLQDVLLFNHFLFLLYSLNQVQMYFSSFTCLIRLLILM